jgi:hypothetical protein
MEKSSRKYTPIIIISLKLIFIGVLVKILEILLANRYGELGAWRKFYLELLNHASVALFSVAILGFILETRHFYEYFHTLIVDTIIDKRFLRDLQIDRLEKLQKKCLETFFNIDELDKEEGFYNFYLKKIQNHIGGPFREKTIALTNVRYTDDGNSFIATDDITYTCRKLGSEIQDKAGWTAEKDEIDEVSEFEITLTKPGTTSESRGYKKGEEPDPSLEAYSGHGFTLPLKEYRNCDGLQISVRAIYVVPLERPFSWTMPCLSHGFSGSITYPSDLELFFDSFGLDEFALPKTKPEEKNGSRTYHFEHGSWLLPDQGFAFHFRRAKSANTVGPKA